mgnify:CR=1 FL=1
MELSDKELLELAAKAAGMDPIRSSWGATMVRGDGSGPRGKPTWNPLEDDADALRLAVRTGLLVLTARGFAVANHDDLPSAIRIAVGDDPYAATRRAIVRAAAEIGRYDGRNS